MKTQTKIFISAFIAFQFLTAFNTIAQTKINPSAIKYTSIKRLHWREGPPFSELGFLDTIFNKQNLVMLSESDHGDGTTMEAECVILKKLIDNNQISSLYIEASWLIVDRITEILIQKGKDGHKEVIEIMASIDLLYWVDNGFWDYLEQKVIEGKIKLYGFDVFLSTKVVAGLLDEALEKKSIKSFMDSIYQKLPKYYENVLYDLKNTSLESTQSGYGEDDYKELKPLLSKIIDVYTTERNENRVKQWKTIDAYFYWLVQARNIMIKNKVTNQPKNERQHSEILCIRDHLMAANFFSIYQKNKEEKAVILVSNYHATKSYDDIYGVNKCCKEQYVDLFHDILLKKFGVKIYNIAFINPYGHHGVQYYKPVLLKKNKYPKPPKNSLEFVISKLYNGNYCFIDLQQEALKNVVFKMRPVFYKYFSSNWSNNYTAVIYIRKMEPLCFLGSVSK